MYGINCNWHLTYNKVPVPYLQLPYNKDIAFQYRTLNCKPRDSDSRTTDTPSRPPSGRQQSRVKDDRGYLNVVNDLYTHNKPGNWSRAGLLVRNYVYSSRQYRHYRFVTTIDGSGTTVRVQTRTPDILLWLLLRHCIPSETTGNHVTKIEDLVPLVSATKAQLVQRTDLACSLHERTIHARCFRRVCFARTDYVLLHRYLSLQL